MRYLQEGRFGYEEYAAAGLQLLGFDTTAASAREPYDRMGIYGIPITYDARAPEDYGAHTYVVTETALLSGIELGWGVVCLKRQLAPDSAAGEAYAVERASAEAAWHKVACGVVPGAAPVVLGALPNGAVFAMEHDLLGPLAE